MEEKNYEDVEQTFWEYEKEGDSIVGVYISKQEDVGMNKSCVFNLDQPNGKIISIWSSTVLENKFKLVKIGDDLKIIYLGEKKAEKGNRTYKDFKIQKAEIQAQQSSA